MSDELNDKELEGVVGGLGKTYGVKAKAKVSNTTRVKSAVASTPASPAPKTTGGSCAGGVCTPA